MPSFRFLFQQIFTSASAPRQPAAMLCLAAPLTRGGIQLPVIKPASVQMSAELETSPPSAPLSPRLPWPPLPPRSPVHHLSADDTWVDRVMLARAQLLAVLYELAPRLRARDTAPATNASLSGDDQLHRLEQVEQVHRLEGAVAELESLATPQSGSARSSSLEGSWRLLYTNANEVTALAELPMGFEMGSMYQIIDLNEQTYENQASVLHRFGIARGSTRVIGEFRPAAAADYNRTAQQNERGNLVEVRVQRVLVTLDSLSGLPTGGRVNKLLANPSRGANKPGTLEIVYLDHELRVTRDLRAGVLFVHKKEMSPMPTLSGAEREALMRQPGEHLFKSSKGEAFFKSWGENRAASLAQNRSGVGHLLAAHQEAMHACVKVLGLFLAARLEWASRRRRPPPDGDSEARCRSLGVAEKERLEVEFPERPEVRLPFFA